ncbi:MAG: hypothetical protein AVDCRST_MAG19-2990 [uncultured Thermomicrobiales bacterium]|uniref:Nudix hydrolase domain-containing protein n=1 Tax=uncultured Thermomicrobiales bacterium TaxID=1645740 RepID=A0A6J4V9C4_9BACT|nr:MAG: hypothetical protein AVDCRST_MAG19-2990 [uncultured Thermomicrobiales bacterium]
MTSAPRARALIVCDGAVALIERRRDGRRYLVFPGGVAESETPGEAAAREVMEEPGLLIEVGPQVAEVMFGGDVQIYCLATIVGGEFGAGRGREMTGHGGRDPGTYAPLWVPVDDLPRKPVRPGGVAELVLAAVKDGWSTEEVTFHDG